MAKPPVYVKIRSDRDNSMRQYRSLVERAGNRALDKIGRRAAMVARANWTRNATGESKASIAYHRQGNVVVLTIGTLAGAVQEFGRGEGARGGPTPALGALRRGMGTAMQGHIGILRDEMQGVKR